MYYQGSKRVQTLIKNLGDISNYVIHQEHDNVDKQEWMSILQVFLAAQENQDYILMADVLESDILIFLQKIQNSLMSTANIEIADYWEKNLQCLKEKDRGLYDELLKYREENAHIQFEPMMAINGQPTLKVHVNTKTFCMHSTVNPESEAKALAENWRKEVASKYQIFGMGMGYHVKALLETDESIRVSVFEHHIEPVILAFHYLDFTKFLQDDRLSVVYEADVLQLMQSLQKASGVFYLHHPSLQCVEQPQMRELLEDYFLNTSTMIEQGDLLSKNFKYLQEKGLPEVTELRSIFENKKVAIIAGGPSVDDELENLIKYRNELSILSVGTVAQKLIQAGIEPDAIIITDPQDTMYRQVEKIDLVHIPLILLSTASKTVFDTYRGPMYLAYQYGVKEAEKIAEEKGYTLFHTGGSVTTTALDVALTFQAKKIILVGADMAFTDMRSHAQGLGYEISTGSGYRQVPSVTGGTVYTSRNLDVYRKWIERRITNVKQPLVYNTSRGARIAGTIECGLEEIMDGCNLVTS